MHSNESKETQANGLTAVGALLPTMALTGLRRVNNRLKAK